MLRKTLSNLKNVKPNSLNDIQRYIILFLLIYTIVYSVCLIYLYHINLAFHLLPWIANPHTSRLYHWHNNLIYWIHLHKLFFIYNNLYTNVLYLYLSELTVDSTNQYNHYFSTYFVPTFTLNSHQSYSLIHV